MTISREDSRVLEIWGVDPENVTVKDVERLNALQQIFGDPRKRVEVSETQSVSPSPTLPTSSRFSI